MITLSRSLNTILALALVAVAGGGCTKAARSQRAVERADHLYQTGDYSAAESAYSNAWRMVVPHNTVALRQLGFIYAEEGRLPEAFSCLQQAAKAEPTNARVQIELATVLASGGRVADAKEAARRALKLQPGNEKALMALCDVIRGTEDAEQTRHYIEQLQKEDQQDRGSYHLAFGVIDARETNMVAAESELNKAHVLDPKSSMVYVALARLSAFHNNLKGADESFKKAVELAPLRSPTRIIYADFQARTGATNQAMENMVELSRQAPDYLPPLLFMMKLCFEERKWDECNSYIARVLEHEPGSYEALLLKAEVSLAKKDGKQAVADFERLFRENPKIARARDQYQFAQAYLLEGDKSKAVSSLNRALELDTNYIPAKITLADMDMRQGNASSAIATLTQVLKQPHLSRDFVVPANLMLAQSYLLKDSPAEAIAIYQGLEQSFPKEVQLPFLEGQARLIARQRTEARAAFEKALAVNPDYFPAVEELVDLDLAESRYAAALERVKTQMDKDPTAPAPWILQATIYLRQKENAQAETDLEKAIQLDPKLPMSYFMLAKLYVDQNQEKKALDKLDTLVKLTNSVSALTEIGMIHEQLKDYDQARQAYEKALAVNPQSGSALNNLACLYSDHFNDLDNAAKLAEKDRELFPNDPYVADTLGWILYKKHDYPRAVALLQESVEKHPSAAVHYHLGMAHYMLGEEDPARLDLKFALSKKDFENTNDALLRLKILDFNPKTASAADRADLEKEAGNDAADPVATIRLAALQEHDGEFAKAADSYDKVIKQSPENVQAIIRLAALDATKLNQAQKGLELAKTAHTLAPDDPYISETLGRMIFQARDYPYALSLLEAAARLLPSQPDLLHDLAWAYFSVGNVSAARDYMQSALKTGAAFDKQNDARQFIEMLGIYDNPPKPPAPARVQQVLQADASYAPALMAAGLMQEQQGQGREAEQSYEKILAIYPLFLPAVRQLSILYAHDGNNDAKAYNYAVQAAAAFPDDADLAKVVGLVEYRRKNYAPSLRSLNQSARTKKDDAELLWYLGMDYYALNQPAEAKKALNQAVKLKLPADLDAEAKRVLGLLK